MTGMELEVAGGSMPEPERFELYTKDRRRYLIDALEDGSFIPTAARHANIPPKVLHSWIDHGQRFPNGPLGRFSREVNKILAKRDDERRKAVWKLAHEKKDWQGIARLGEQDSPDTWRRPSEKSSSSVTVNIIDKLAVLHGDKDTLTTGD